MWVLFQQEQEVLAQNLDLVVQVQVLCPLEVETWARFGLHDHLAEIRKILDNYISVNFKKCLFKCQTYFIFHISEWEVII